MRRREVIGLLSGAAAWPVATLAQPSENMRQLGVLLNAAADDSEYQAWLRAFLQELAGLGWSIGRNVRMEIRWATADATSIRRNAAELAMLRPDVILASVGSTVGPLLAATRTVPIVFPRDYRSSSGWLRRKLVSARAKCHWLHEFRIQHWREVG